MRILFLNYETALGSAVHATPLFAGMRSFFPRIEIHSLGSGIAADVLEANPHIDHHWRSPHLWSETGRGLRWLLENRSKMGRFDRILFNSGNGRTKGVLASRLIKAGRRDGFSVHKHLVNEHLTEEPGLSLIANNLKLLDLLGAPQPTSSNPEIWFSGKEADAATGWRNNLENAEAPAIGFFAGTSGGHPNQWYDERFVEVANGLYREFGTTAVFFGGSKDLDHAQRLSDSCQGPALPMAGQTSITQLASMIAVCDQIISVDTGGLHVAWAVNTPTLVLGHAANPRHIWLPQGNPLVTVIRKDEKVPCALCRKHFCATRECMDEISAREVLEVSTRQFQLFPPSSDNRQQRLVRWTNRAFVGSV